MRLIGDWLRLVPIEVEGLLIGVDDNRDYEVTGVGDKVKHLEVGDRVRIWRRSQVQEVYGELYARELNMELKLN
jgi:hypothetical protein